MRQGAQDERRVRVRGTQDGIRLLLPPAVPFSVILSQVRELLDGQAAFFSGAALTLDLSEREPRLDELVSLQRELDARGIRIRTLSAATPAARECLARWGFRLEESFPPPRLRLIEPGTEETPDGTATYVRKTLRSGMTVQSDGHLVIIGDVNPGALVSAGGDVLVWGVVRGTIQAGRSGDTEAVIAALRLVPMQLRIANLVARAPDQGGKSLDTPAIARVVNGQIVIEPWRVERR